MPRILSTEDVWCQGFSEPNAGSDLAAIRTTARQDGDELVIDGQKVWTSWARWANWCFVLVRTSSQGRKHDGLTFVLIDMHTPGVSVRPLRQITGSQEFVELFFDGVRVPLANVVGDAGQGWSIAMTTLSHERGPMVTARAVRLQREFDDLLRLARLVERDGQPALRDPLLRDRLARLYGDVQILRYNAWRSLTRMLQGHEPGAEGSLGKLFWSETHQRLTELALDILGPRSPLWRGSRIEPEDGLWQLRHLTARGETIYAGTSEIQRNIIAERVLGLPR